MRHMDQQLRTFIMQKQVNSSRNNATEKFVANRQKCLKKDHDMTCHEFFKRCYISSSRPQLLCREACEDLIFNVCKQEAKIFADFLERMRSSGRRYAIKVMDCTEMPFRNESPNCYYPDQMRG